MDVSPKLELATFGCIGSQTFVCIGNEPFRSYFDIGENPKAIEKEFLQWENVFENFVVNFHDFRCETRLSDPIRQVLVWILNKSLYKPPVGGQILTFWKFRPQFSKRLSYFKMKQYFAFGFSATQKYVRKGSENVILNVWERIHPKVASSKIPSVDWEQFTGWRFQSW